jgi:RNA polymerase sigma-70 factor (ECF subfamily)
MLAEAELKDLLVAVARGEHAALRKIYNGHAARLFGMAMAMLRDRPAAADALQDALLKVWERARQFDPARCSAETWLTGMLRTSALEIARARGREMPEGAAGLGEVAVDPDALDGLKASEDGLRLRECLQRLEPKTRHAVVLAFVHGLSQPELAYRLDLSLDAVKSSICRGLASLRAGQPALGPVMSLAGQDRSGLPTDAGAREAMAGEYVLGTLDACRAGRVAVAMQTDPLWRQAVEAWEAMLSPLAWLARPEPPPPDGWERIEARIAPQRSPRARRAFRVAWLWRLWAFTASAAAVSSVVFILQSRRPVTHMVAVLVTDRNAPALVAEVDPGGGGLRLAAYPAPTGRQLQTPSERDLQIWGLVPGATVPVNMGLMPHEPGRLTLLRTPGVKLVSGMLIEITLEPQGGSPTDKPTGPVVFFGRLGAEVPEP